MAAIGGFPYLLQLVGFRAWDVDLHDSEITPGAMRIGIRQGKSELETRIFSATWQDLSGNGRPITPEKAFSGSRHRLVLRDEKPPTRYEPGRGIFR